ncbi:hypothetical protein SEA_INKED_50 [Arthrobacter phage Inked]|jgi:hypothetical protein|nr:hypothetical protein SEA_INKED_50 [Arthrobacter phage Inked]
MVTTYKAVQIRQSLRNRIAQAKKQGRYDVVARLTVKLENTHA